MCVCSSDVSPTGQGVDHRQVQRELGEVAVQLQDPVTLTTASIRVSWTVSGSLWSSVLFRGGAFEGSVRRNVFFISTSPLFHLLF